MRPLSPNMAEKLALVARAGPTGYRTWHGRTLDALLNRGLVRYDVDPTCRGRVFYFLTDAGNAELARRQAR